MSDVLGIIDREFIVSTTCKHCKNKLVVTNKDLVLREIEGIPVNSFNCPSCKVRNYIFTEEFAANLLHEFIEYKRNNPHQKIEILDTLD